MKETTEDAAGYVAHRMAYAHLPFFNSHLLREGVTHSGLDPPTSISNQDNPPKDTLPGQSDLGNSSVKIPFSEDSRLCRIDA